jgi:glycosyltransferase involved in cell wall biosynthesis
VISERLARVNIALPVFNGERFLAEAIESILHQTYEDFRLILCDNASTDGTGEICRHYAGIDDRVRYLRNDQNLGAAPNFNRAFDLANAEYFKWHACDDLLAPNFLDVAVSVLDSHKDAVLFQSRVRHIDGAGNDLETSDAVRRDMDHARASKRLAAHLRSLSIWTIYGLIRSAALRRTAGFQSHQYADSVLLGELALVGPFATTDEVIFMNRRHSLRYGDTAALHPKSSSMWWDTSQTTHVKFHEWKQYTGYAAAIRRQVPERSARLRCYSSLLFSLARPRNAFLFVLGLIGMFEPRVVRAAKQTKRRLARVVEDHGGPFRRWIRVYGSEHSQDGRS